jgi:hypothetical protein
VRYRDKARASGNEDKEHKTISDGYENGDGILKSLVVNHKQKTQKTRETAVNGRGK